MSEKDNQPTMAEKEKLVMDLGEFLSWDDLEGFYDVVDHELKAFYAGNVDETDTEVEG